MRLTKDQIKNLEPYEEHFRTVMQSRYARYPGMNGVKLIYDVYKTIVKNAPPLNHTCQNCIFRMLNELAPIYFHDKEEMMNAHKPKPKKKKK